MEFKEDKRTTTGRTSVTLFCLEKNCEFDTTSGAVMYDHLKITHNFMLFEDRPRGKLVAR